MKRIKVLITTLVLIAALPVFSQLPRVYGPTDKPTFLIMYPGELSGDTVFAYVKADKNYIIGKFAWNGAYGINLRCEGPVSGNVPGTDEPIRTGAKHGEKIHIGMLIDGSLYSVVPDSVLWPVRGGDGITQIQPVEDIKYYPTTIYFIKNVHIGNAIDISLSEVPVFETITPPEPEPEPEPVAVADFELISYQDECIVVGTKNNKLAMQNLTHELIKFRFGRGWRNVQGGLKPGEFKTFSRASIFRGELTLEYEFEGENVSEQFYLQ